MKQLSIPEHVLLKKMLARLKLGENIEQAMFNSNIFDSNVLMHLQLGCNAKDCLSMIQFKYNAITTLLSTASKNMSDETLKRIEATAKIIEKREEAIKELETVLNIHQRRIRIIHIITVLIIGILAGFSPLFLSLQQMINFSEIAYSIKISTNLGVAMSFLLINVLNSYFLLQIANDKRKSLKILLTIIIHILLVFAIHTFLQKTTPFL